MTPDYQTPDGRVTLYCADCLEVLPTLGKVDAVVTDPPFGIGYKYESHDDSAKHYEALLLPVIEHARRLTDGGPCFFWQSMKTAPKWASWFGSEYRIFAACKSFVQLRPVEVQFAWDPVIFWGCGSGKHNESIRDWHVANTPNFGGGRESIPHPCPRPLDQVCYVVHGLDAETILDPFMGSGTTGIACIRTGRRFIGIEIERKYFDIAVERIERELSQPMLFEPTPAPAIQESLL